MPNETEEILAPLIYSQLQEQIPKLIPNLVGLHLVAEEDEKTRNLGILLFNINNKHYYILTFYLNGFLKPLIIMYDTKKRSFLPATEKMVDFLTKPMPGMQTIPVGMDKFRQVMSVPNLYKLSLPPMMFGKYGSFFQDAVKVASNASKFHLLTLFKDNPAVLRKVAAYKPNIINDLRLVEKKAEQVEELIIKTEPSNENTPEENTKIYNNEIVIIDNRKDTNDISLKSVDDNHVWGGFTDNGKYKVLNNRAEFENFYCAKAYNGYQDYTSWYLFSDDDKTYEVVSGDVPKIHAEKIEPDNSGLLSRTIPLKDIEMGSRYLLLAPNGVFGPFNLDAKGGIKYSDFHYDILLQPHIDNVVDIIHTSNEIIASPNVPCIKVQDITEFRPGTHKDLLAKIYSLGADSVEVLEKDSIYTIRGKDKEVRCEGLYKDAMIHLVKNEGVTEKNAKFMLSNLGAYFIKKSYFPETTTYTQERVPMPQISEVRTPDPEMASRQAVQQDVQLLLNATNSNTESIIDTALVGILSKNQNNTERVKELIPILVKATSALGSQLFDIWWNSKNYTEEFTIDELYELEQSVLSTFKSLGDIVLDLMLRKKIYGESI